MPQKIFTIESENLIKKQDFAVDFEHSNPILPTTKNVHLKLEKPKTKKFRLSRFNHFIIGIPIFFFLFLVEYGYEAYFNQNTKGKILSQEKFYQLEAEWKISEGAFNTINEIEANGGPICKIKETLTSKIKKMNANLSEEYFLQKPHQDFLKQFSIFTAFVINGILFWMGFMELTHHQKWLLTKLYEGEKIPEVKSKNYFVSAFLLYIKYPNEIYMRKRKIYGNIITLMSLALGCTVYFSNVFVEDSSPVNFGFFPACGRDLQNSIPSSGTFFNMRENANLENIIVRYQTEINLTQEIMAENQICDSILILTEKLNNAMKNINEFETCKKLKLLKNQIIVAVNLILFSINFAVIFNLRKHLSFMDKFGVFIFVMGEIVFLNGTCFYH